MAASPPRDDCAQKRPLRVPILSSIGPTGEANVIDEDSLLVYSCATALEESGARLRPMAASTSLAAKPMPAVSLVGRERPGEAHGQQQAATMEIMINPREQRTPVVGPAPVRTRASGNQWNWRPEWTLHVDCIDADHRLIADQLKQLARAFERCVASRSGPGAARVLARLEVVGAMTQEHFFREEQIMHAAEYPSIASHQAEHVLLLTRYAHLKRAIRSEGAKALSDLTIPGLQKWFFGHVLGEDRALSLFLRRSGFASLSLPEPLMIPPTDSSTDPQLDAASQSTRQ
jgi:hemerythrin-like metal-binding protein